MSEKKSILWSVLLKVNGFLLLFCFALYHPLLAQTPTIELKTTTPTTIYTPTTPTPKDTQTPTQNQPVNVEGKETQPTTEPTTTTSPTVKTQPVTPTTPVAPTAPTWPFKDIKIPTQTFPSIPTIPMPTLPSLPNLENLKPPKQTQPEDIPQPVVPSQPESTTLPAPQNIEPSKDTPTTVTEPTAQTLPTTEPQPISTTMPAVQNVESSPNTSTTTPAPGVLLNTDTGTTSGTSTYTVSHPANEAEVTQCLQKGDAFCEEQNRTGPVINYYGLSVCLDKVVKDCGTTSPSNEPPSNEVYTCLKTGNKTCVKQFTGDSRAQCLEKLVKECGVVTKTTDVQSPAQTQLISVDCVKNVVRIKGISVFPANMTANSKGKQVAKKKALENGYQNFMQDIQNLQVDSKTLTKDIMAKNPKASTKLIAFLKGARVVSEQQLKDGTYEIILEAPLYGKGGINDLLSKNLALKTGKLPYSCVEDFHPFPPLPTGTDAESMKKSKQRVVIIDIGVESYDKFTLKSIKVVYSYYPMHIWNPPLIKIKVYDAEGKLMREFNEWHPLWSFEVANSTEQHPDKLVLLEKPESYGRYIIPISLYARQIDIVDPKQNKTLLIIDKETLLKAIQSFCLYDAFRNCP